MHARLAAAHALAVAICGVFDALGPSIRAVLLAGRTNVRSALAPGLPQAHRRQDRAHQAAADAAQGLPPRQSAGQRFCQFVESIHGYVLSVEEEMIELKDLCSWPSLQTENIVRATRTETSTPG